MIDADAFEKLGELFWRTIPFGTGGRRGMMGELGSATINERTIAESADGLAMYLQRQKAALGGRAVVAHDTRNRSPEFARLTATTLAAHGLTVFCFDTHRSTPALSFAVRELNCDVGVMISASHNPPSDNGFKAYWSNGGQVLPPHDQGIIECVDQAAEIPAINFNQAITDGRIEIIGEELDRKYIDAVLALSLSSARDVSAIFTPLHGVGETSVYRVLHEAGFAGVEIFDPQRCPDGDFTNVPNRLPNPERRDVFEPAIKRADETGAELILASDPDADRLGLCVKGREGEFIHLSGNQIGVLLLDYILRKRSEAGTLSGDHFVVETLVTTPMIAAVAQAHGVRVIDDLLVGFKYIAETVDQEEADRFVFGAEESLGYLAGSYCRDKDAAVAALFVLELAAELKLQDKTLLDRLDELYVMYGYFVEGQQSEVCRGEQGKNKIQRLMQAFRHEPMTKLAGVVLVRVRDYGRHEIRRLPENKKVDALLKPDGNLLFFESAETGSRFSMAVRPSGTEPKIKFYFFAQAACDDALTLPNLKNRTDEQLQLVQQALSRWVRTNVLSNSSRQPESVAGQAG